jgi:hypothetical protein
LGVLLVADNKCLWDLAAEAALQAALRVHRRVVVLAADLMIQAKPVVTVAAGLAVILVAAALPPHETARETRKTDFLAVAAAVAAAVATLGAAVVLVYLAKAPAALVAPVPAVAAPVAGKVLGQTTPLTACLLLAVALPAVTSVVTAQCASSGPAQLARSRLLTLAHHKEKSCW